MRLNWQRLRMLDSAAEDEVGERPAEAVNGFSRWLRVERNPVLHVFRAKSGVLTRSGIASVRAGPAMT